VETKKNNINEVYNLFSKFGITKEELTQMINKITLDRKKIEPALIDLFLSTFIKNGFNQKHLLELYSLFGHQRHRAKHLEDKLRYLHYIL